MGASRNEIGTFVTPVEGVPGAYHAAWYFTRVEEGGKLKTTIIQGLPTTRPPALVELLEGLKQTFGIANTHSPFGSIKVDRREFDGSLTDGVAEATNVRRLSAGYNFDGELDRHWGKIEDVFEAAKDASYLPLQNSNSVAYLAGKNAGFRWPYDNGSGSNRTRPDRPTLIVPGPSRPETSSPWLPGAREPVAVPFQGGAQPAEGGPGKSLSPLLRELQKRSAVPDDPVRSHAHAAPTPAFQSEAVYPPDKNFFGNFAQAFAVAPAPSPAGFNASGPGAGPWMAADLNALAQGIGRLVSYGPGQSTGNSPISHAEAGSPSGLLSRSPAVPNLPGVASVGGRANPADFPGPTSSANVDASGSTPFAVSEDFRRLGRRTYSEPPASVFDTGAPSVPFVSPDDAYFSDGLPGRLAAFLAGIDRTNQAQAALPMPDEGEHEISGARSVPRLVRVDRNKFTRS